MAPVVTTVNMLKNEAETARLAWRDSIIDEIPHRGEYFFQFRRR